jgi:gluconokinase
MGVTGAGKTTVGASLAGSLGWEFIDADDLHPPANVEKMRVGRPLTDADRWPWLARLNELLHERAERRTNVVLACSALKASYRDVLLRGIPDARLVYLRGSESIIAARLAERRGHYMNPALLASQLATLEEPRDVIVVDIAEPPAVLVGAIRAQLAVDPAAR